MYKGSDLAFKAAVEKRIGSNPAIVAVWIAIHPPSLWSYPQLLHEINLATQLYMKPLKSPGFKATLMTKHTKFGILAYPLIFLTFNLRVLFL